MFNSVTPSSASASLATAITPPSSRLQKPSFSDRMLICISEAVRRIPTTTLVTGAVAAYGTFGAVAGACIGAVNASLKDSDVSEGAYHGAMIGGISTAGCMTAIGAVALAMYKLSANAAKLHHRSMPPAN